MQTQFQRTTATAVTKKDPPGLLPHSHPSHSIQTTTRMGTCGHALLEEAAHHNWHINFPERIRSPIVPPLPFLRRNKPPFIYTTHHR